MLAAVFVFGGVVAIPACPDPIPPEMDELLLRLAQMWRDAPSRPRVALSVCAAWDGLLLQWQQSDLPLLIRQVRKEMARGEALSHVSGRTIIPTDNTTANWVLSQALEGLCPTISDIALKFAQRSMPVAMMFKGKAESDRAWQKGTREGVLLNALGWKVCHIEPVGLGRGDLLQRPLSELQDHFFKFLSPTNMFVVPKALGGMGELPHFVSAMRGQLSVA